MNNLHKKTEEFVTELLSNKLDKRYVYHNLDNTRQLAEWALELLENTKLDKQDRLEVLLTIWFYNTGFTENHKNHVDHSCSIARRFLTKIKADEQLMDNVCGLLLNTQADQAPKTTKEKILRDTLTADLAQDDFKSRTELLRLELANLGEAECTVGEWREENIVRFQSKHRFYTEYAQKKWQQGKEDNLAKLIKSRKKAKKDVKKAKLKAKFKDKSPQRGVQTLYRVTLRNHLKLSDIADTKANILLSVNAIILSLLLTNLVPTLDNPKKEYLIWPTLIFILFSIGSIIISVMATKPNVTRSEFSESDIQDKKVNLLFFGNFTQMPLKDYIPALREVLQDKNYIYDMLTTDLYYLGKVLDRKYTLLRLTYTVFLLGMILSVIAFGVAVKFYAPVEVLEAVKPLTK